MTAQTLYVRDAAGAYAPADSSIIIASAKRQIALNFQRGAALESPAASREFVRFELIGEKYEVFGCVFLDNQHRVITFEKLFHGTIDSTSVYPRVVVDRALAHNAAAVILAHNHPSGKAEPSTADRNITGRLKDALALIDVRVLDHLVVGAEEAYSFAEHGLI